MDPLKRIMPKFMPHGGICVHAVKLRDYCEKCEAGIGVPPMRHEIDPEFNAICERYHARVSELMTAWAGPDWKEYVARAEATSPTFNEAVAVAMREQDRAIAELDASRERVRSATSY